MKKIGLICLALVLALGTMGIGFAWWTETLDIGANPVNTGELDAEFTGASAAWSWNQPRHTTATLTQTAPQTLALTMGNLYPGTGPRAEGAAKILFNIKNTGSIPVRITDLRITKTGGDSEVWDNLQFSYHVKHRYANGTWKESWQLDNAGGPPTTDVWVIALGALSDRVLLPGEYFDFGEPEGAEDESWWFAIRSSAGNSVEGRSVSFNVVFTASQFNATP